jgi:TIR domain/KAP family P-loop domain
MSEIANQKIIYVSYSHKDKEWKERIVSQLRPFLDSLIPDNWDFWDDSRIGAGREWNEEIQNAIDKASLVLMLVSKDFLASEFIIEIEAANFIERAKKTGISIIPILLHQCRWQQTDFIAQRQILPRDLIPLSVKTEEEFIAAVRDIAKEISAALETVNFSNQTEEDSVDEKVVESDSETMVGDLEEPGLVPISRLNEFDLSPTAEKILERAINAGKRHSGSVPLSTSSLFFSIVKQGRESSGVSGTSTFLANFIKSLAENRYSEIESTYQLVQSDYILHEPQMTSAVFETLKKAEQLAEQVTRRGQIHARQIFAALINQVASGNKTGFQTRLEEMEIPFSQLQDGFLSYLKEAKEDTTVWENFLLNKQSQKKRIMRFTGYQADDAKGDVDWLLIDDDVNAFASLIASRTVSPPLSIGLFGEWGSGKTFFMHRLRNRVDKLAKEARNSEKMQRDIPYYKRIAQIEFNAWHYVESNLWASLVEHIFDNLRVAGEHDKKMVEKLQEHLLKKINVEKTAEKQASAKATKAKQDLRNIETELGRVKKKLENDTNTLESIRAKDILDTVKLSDSDIQNVDYILKELGMERNIEKAQSLVGALGEARAIIERGNSLLTPLIKSKNRGKRIVWLVLCIAAAPLVGLLLIWIKNQSDSPLITEGVATLAGIATLIGSCAAWIGRQASWVSKLLGKAERAQQQIDAKIAERQAAAQAEIAKTEKEFDISKSQYEAALREKEAAKQRVAEAEAEFKEATSERLLSKFIQDRAASDDYRKHLGVLALVRDDFENLSNYIEEQNWRLAPIDPTEEENSKPIKKFKSLKAEDKEKDLRINRIVLYIDDLDRCPPNKVVDVLQAVHLLLAFPLFVVVVGVDARWITRSLETRYRELLHNSKDEGKANGDAAAETLIGTATPGDYLEKIFQIPFWLNPMDEDARVRMVGGLLKGELKSKDGEAANDAQTGKNGDSKKETQSKDSAAERQKTGKSASKTASGGKTSSDDKTQSTKQNASETANEPAHPAENLLNQPNLEILQEEYEFIGELTPLLGRSPRALKRFVNVYRLIKAGLYEEELDSFLNSKFGLPDYQVVLFLLAVDTGAPSISAKLFRRFRKIFDRHAQKSADSASMDFQWLLSEFKDDDSSDWLQVKSWLESRRETWGLKYSLRKIGGWIPRVARYSFQSRKI